MFGCLPEEFVGALLWLENPVFTPGRRSEILLEGYEIVFIIEDFEAREVFQLYANDGEMRHLCRDSVRTVTEY